MKTAILTDTNSVITAEEGKRVGIYVLPMPVIINGTYYLEGVDITNEQLYRAAADGRELSSSQPSPGDLMAMWDRILGDGYEDLVYIPMSSGLSGSCHTACVLAEEYGAKVWVADNHRISVTLMESVFDAKWLAGQGKTAKEIKACLEANAHRSSIYITVNSLSYLKKSGRITLAAAGLADILGIKPILTIQGEKLEPFAKARGVRQSERKTLPCSIACHVGVDAIGIGVSVIEKRS